MSSRLKSSGLITSSQIIKNAAGYLSGFLLVKEGIGQIVGTLYDNNSASGLIVAKLVVANTERHAYLKWEEPVWFKKGLFLSLSGLNPQAIIYFD